MKGIENGNHGKLIRFELGGAPLSKSDEFAVVAMLYTLHSHPSQILIYQKTRHLLGAEPCGASTMLDTAARAPTATACSLGTGPQMRTAGMLSVGPQLSASGDASLDCIKTLSKPFRILPIWF